MFGYFTNKKFSENEVKLLKDEPDDTIWYLVILKTLFKESRFFQIREDIEVPKKEDDDGVVLIFNGSSVVYFRTMDSEITNEEVLSIFDVCFYLENLFNKPIDAYVACSANTGINVSEIDCKGNVTIYFSSFSEKDGEIIVDKLQNKLDNHEKFSFSDSIDHIMLPFLNYQDREVFYKKYHYYMDCVNSYNFD